MSDPLLTDLQPSADGADRGVRPALARFRVLAYVVGVGLLTLCLAMVLKYAADLPQYMRVVGPAHGFLYAVYLVCAVDLALKARWSVRGTVLVLLAGMVPLLSFVAERWVTRKVTAGERV